jgi:hypothetical protein
MLQMNIWEQKIHERYIHLNQSLVRTNEQMNDKRVRFGTRIQEQGYSPIKSTDMPLEKLLKEQPRYRYNYLNED